jgi:hypothetical protein
VLPLANTGYAPRPRPSRHPRAVPDVLDDRFEPGRAFDVEIDLDGITDSYSAMDERRAFKSPRAAGVSMTVRCPRTSKRRRARGVRISA